MSTPTINQLALSLEEKIEAERNQCVQIALAVSAKLRTYAIMLANGDAPIGAIETVRVEWSGQRSLLLPEAVAMLDRRTFALAQLKIALLSVRIVEASK